MVFEQFRIQNNNQEDFLFTRNKYQKYDNLIKLLISCKVSTEQDLLSIHKTIDQIIEINQDCLYCEVQNSKYYNKQEKQCRDCSDNCLHCVDNLFCKQCDMDYQLIENQCVKKLNVNNNSLKNIQCQEQCRCLFSNYDNCLLCFQSCLFSTNQNILQPNTIQKQRKLQSCPSNCQKCQNISNTRRFLNSGVTAEGIEVGNKIICVKCDEGYFLNANQDVCSGCTDDRTYFDVKTQICQNCQTGCLSCDSAENCKICDAINSYYPQINASGQTNCSLCQSPGYSLIGTDCIKCNDKCDTCDANNQCKTCISGYVKFISNGIISCVLCDQPGYSKLNNKCIKCPDNCNQCSAELKCNVCAQNYYILYSSADTSTFQCVKCQDPGNSLLSGQKCIKCSQNCISCSDFNQCDQCENGYGIVNKSGFKICKQCQNTSGIDCIICDSQQYIDPSTNLCRACDLTIEYIDGFYCRKCDQSCVGCTGSTINDCNSCKSGYQKIDKIGCQFCYDSTADSTQVNLLKKRCLKSQTQCLLNLKSKQYETTFICTECQSQYILLSNICITTCSDLGDKFEYDQVKNTCTCPSSFPYLHISNSEYQFCQSQQQSGYFCQGYQCYQCYENCQTCSDSVSCKQCFQGYYIWQNQCIDSCQSNLNLQIDESQQNCQCLDGYDYRAEYKMCIIQLKVISLDLTNSEQYNILTFQLNREPLNNEIKNILLQINPQTLKIAIDYNIKSFVIIKDQIIFQVEVLQNRKVSLLILTLNDQVMSFNIKNTLLTTEAFNKYQQSNQAAAQSMNSMSEALTPKGGLSKDIIDIMKQFQILCFLSNFVQLFGPLVVFRTNMPSPLVTGSILGASFVFQKIPSASTISVESTITDQQANQTSESEQVFTDLGITTNIYKDFLFPHLFLQISVILSLLCFIARLSMRGKQYTMQIVNTLINLMSSMNQGYITSALFSIYCSLKFAENKGWAIWQLIVHVIFIGQMSIMIVKNKEADIINKNPNFILNINVKARGWRSYLILSYLKKYLCIILILAFQNSPIVICIIISTIFIVFSIYLAYFRFFSHLFFTIYKPLQELLIGVTFLTISICIYKYENTMSRDVVSDEELIQINKLSLIVLIMLLSCLAVSTLLFIVRIVVKLNESLVAINNYLAKRKNSRIRLQNIKFNFENPNDSIQTNNITIKEFLKSQVKNVKTTIQMQQQQTMQSKQQFS